MANSLAEWDKKYLNKQSESLEEWDRKYMPQTQSTVRGTVRTTPVDNSIVHTASKPSPPVVSAVTPTAQTQKPIQISALGAGDYGSDKGKRVGKTVKGAAQGTGAGLINTLGMFADQFAQSQNQYAPLVAKQTGQKTEDVLKKNAQMGKESQEQLYAAADKLSEKSQKNIDEAKEGLGKVGQTLVDVGVAGTQMLGDIAAGVILPGAGLTAMGLRSFGMGAQEQRQKGGSVQDQFLGGLKSAAIEVLTEKLGGITLGGKAIFGGAVDKAIDSLIKSKGLKAVLKIVADGGSEAVEEIISGVLNPVADRVLDLDKQRGTGNTAQTRQPGEIMALGAGDYGASKTVITSEDVESMIHDGIVGGILGLVGGGTQVAAGAARGQTATPQNTADDNIRAALNLPNPTTAQNAAQAPVSEGEQTTPTVTENGLGEVKTGNDGDVRTNSEMFGGMTNESILNDESVTVTRPFGNESSSYATVYIDTDGNVKVSFEKSKADADRLARNYQAMLGHGMEAVDTSQEGSIQRAIINIENARNAELTEYAASEYGGNEALNAEREKLAALERQREATVNGTALPEGMGAASAEFTGDMTPGEQWVAEAQGQGDSALHPVSNAAQQNLAEQQGRAPQEMPKVDLFGKLTSKTANTIQNSGVTPQQMSDAILEDAAQGKFSRIPYSDTEAINKAYDEIENGEGRYQGALARFKAAVEKGKISKDTVTMGIALYNNAVTAGDYATALDLVYDLVEVGKVAGQSLQAVNILNKLSPEGRLFVAAKAIDRVNTEVQRRYGDRAPNIEVDPAVFAEYEQALQSGDQAAIDTAWAAVEQNVASKIKADWRDKLNAWRYLAMLGNVRTHVRNIFGNFGFSPFVLMKNAVSTAGEAIADKASEKGIERTKAILNPASATDRALIQTAAMDYAEVKDTILAGGKYVDEYSDIWSKRKIFDNKLLEKARKANSDALDAEDSFFSKRHYAVALASYLKANGISPQAYAEGGISDEVKAKARQYAIKEAQKATYRDTNAFSQWVSRLGKGKPQTVVGKAGQTLLEGVLPFKKTPANIAVRAVEYSPAGLLNTIAFDSKKLKNGDMTAAEFIDKLSEGIVGTGLLGLGALLAGMGHLSGGKDDDEKQAEFDALQGTQNYSWVFDDGSTMTLDWLSPESMPIFVGVELYNSFAKKGGGFEDFLSALSNITSPMLEMSMLQSVNDLFDNLAYVGEGKGIPRVLVGSATSYLSQFLPTLGGQIERITEPQRETLFVDRSEGAPKSNTQYYFGKMLNKIPGVDYNQIPYIDAWGRTEESGNVAERSFNNLINPAYMKKSGATEIDDELKRLYAAGQTSVYPTRAATDKKINGEYLTADEYVEYATVRGETSLDVVTKVIGSSAYKTMTDANKANVISYAYKYADAKAQLAVNPNADVAKWLKAAVYGSRPINAIFAHAEEYPKA